MLVLFQATVAAAVCLLSAGVLGDVASVAADAARTNNGATSLTFIYQNNLNLSDNANHVGAIMLDSMNYFNAETACAALSESLITKSTLMRYSADFTAQLSYAEYAGYASSPTQKFWIADNVVEVTEGANTFKFLNPKTYSNAMLPVLCTQTAGTANFGGSATARNNVTVKASDGNTYVGFRNLKSFRFQGIRYASNPGRFQYSSPYNGTGETFDVTAYGSQCRQYGSGSEDCFFLNIFTPYIPKAGSKRNLRAVHFSIHGGGFTGGSGAGGDGGDLSSREDVVTVSINYRLTTYGFMAVPGYLNGNYGIGDQITALEWVVANIASFGGDPKRITIAGQSAGAGSVRTLLGSPLAIGKFQGAIAMSNLGGGHSLGLGGNYGTTYSSYYTVQNAFSSVYAENGPALLLEAGCNQSTLAAQVACLTTTTDDLSTFAYVARYVVQDGTIVNTPDLALQLASPNSKVADVPVIFGSARNDGGSIGSGFSTTCTTELECLMANLYISQPYAQSVIDSGLFPLYDTGSITNDAFNVSQRIATDITFRCIDQATMYAAATSGAFSASYYYQSNRGYAGDAYNPLHLDVTGEISPAYPNGDPSTFYYVVHSADLPSLFGTVFPLRAPSDLYAVQLSTAYFGSFIKRGNPNPPFPELKVRGYTQALKGMKQTGPWNQVSSQTGPLKLMDWPAQTAQFTDVKQCAFLNISSNYYLSGGM